MNIGDKCPVCNKSVYANDPQLVLDGHKYHKACAKCNDCGCNITLSNFTMCGTVLYCKTHYFKRFHEEGSYLGGDKYENKNPRDSKNGGGVAIPQSPTSTNPDDKANPPVETNSKPPLVPPKLELCDNDDDASADIHPIITDGGIPLTRQLTPAVEASETLNLGPDIDNETQPMAGLSRQITPTFSGL